MKIFVICLLLCTVAISALAKPYPCPKGHTRLTLADGYTIDILDEDIKNPIKLEAMSTASNTILEMDVKRKWSIDEDTGETSYIEYMVRELKPDRYKEHSDEIRKIFNKETKWSVVSKL